jgi:ketosteroid isomerase-like protein
VSESTSARCVRALWDAFDLFDFDAAGDLLHDDFVCEWPQSRERIRGRDNFIAVNKHYPGQWRITVERLIASGDAVVTEITARYADQALPAISFFTLREGKILRVREYWPDPMPAADWRAPWVERMEN